MKPEEVSELVDRSATEFDQNLADLGAGIARMRAEMTDLEANKTAYIVEMQNEAAVAVAEVLALSEDVLKQAKSNAEKLEGYANEVEALSHEVVSWLGRVDKAVSDTKGIMELAQVRLRQDREALEDEKARQKAAGAAIEADRKALTAVADAVTAQARNVESRETALKDAVREFETKTNTK